MQDTPNNPLNAPLWQRYLPSILSIIIGVTMTVVAYYFVKQWEEQGIRVNFNKAAEDRTFAVRRALEHREELLRTMDAFLSSQPSMVDYEHFAAYTKPFLRRYPEIQAIEWIPIVSAADRTSYEEHARKFYPDFKITEQDAKGNVVPAGERSEYFPFYYIQPMEGNEVAMGFDIGADPSRLAVLQESRDTGEVKAISHLTLMSDAEGQHGLLMFSPVYRYGFDADSSVPAQRHDNLTGFVLTVFQVGNILQRAMTYLDQRPIDIRVYDESPDVEKQFLYFHPGQLDDEILEKLDDEIGMTDPLNLQVSKKFPIAGRTWSVECSPAPGYYLTTGSGWQALSVLILGLLSTFTLAIYFYTAMRHAYRMAEAANAANLAQSRFLSGMSHQLRTPLNAIIGYSELLREEAEDLDDPTLVQDVEKIYISGRYLLSLSDGILDLSKIKAGKVEVHSETCKIPNVLEEIENIASLLVKKNGNTLEIKCPDDIGTMQTDVTRLHQILFSLINNASDATEHGQIVLDVSRENRHNSEWIRFAIKDNGTGMSKDQREWLENMLANPDNTTTPEGEEVRIGLLISSHFWQMMGGHLNIESTPGEGSLFVLHLPAHMPRAV